MWPFLIHNPAFPSQHDMQGEDSKTVGGLGQFFTAACESEYRQAHDAGNTTAPDSI
jgi:hypothetical protein